MKITIELNENKLKSFLCGLLHLECVKVNGQEIIIEQKKKEPKKKSRYDIYQEAKSIDVVDSGLPIRIINCFNAYGVKNVAGILSCSIAFLRRMRNFGNGSLIALKRYVDSLGYSLESLPPVYVECLTSLRATKTATSEKYTDLFRTRGALLEFIVTENAKIYEALKNEEQNDETTHDA